MAVARNREPGRYGDWLEARSVSGGLPHRGLITEVLGQPGHIRYRVRWDEEHEAIVYPADGVSVVPARRARRGRSKYARPTAFDADGKPAARA